MSDNAADLIALRSQYAPELSSRVDDVEQALADGDGAAAASIAHGLSGSAHVLGLHAFGDAASAVSRLGDAPPEEQRAAVRSLRAALATVAPTDRIDRRHRLNHDLRSPLTAVLGYADLLGDHDLDPSAMAMVNGILEAGETMRRLLDEESAAMDASPIDAVMPDSTASEDGSALDVLVIDDDALVRGVIVAVLDGVDGVTSRSVATLEEADVAIRERVPDVLIIDLHLGGADGAQFLHEARRRCPASFVAVLTGDDPSQRRAELHRLGADVVARKGPADTVRLIVEAARGAR